MRAGEKPKSIGELADVIEIEWDGISARVAMNKQREGECVDKGETGQARECACVWKCSLICYWADVCCTHAGVCVCVWGLTPLWWGRGSLQSYDLLFLVLVLFLYLRILSCVSVASRPHCQIIPRWSSFCIMYCYTQFCQNFCTPTWLSLKCI